VAAGTAFSHAGCGGLRVSKLSVERILVLDTVSLVVSRVLILYVVSVCQAGSGSTYDGHVCSVAPAPVV
jgi:hypothetical protein